MGQTKKCSRCGNEKPISEFYESKRSADGRLSWCKECCAIENKKRRSAKRIEVTEAAKGTHIGLVLEVNGFNLKDIELAVIKMALRYYENDSLKAIAKKVGITERALLRKFKEYDIDHYVERKNPANDIKTKRTLVDYDARDLLKALWDKGYDGHFFTYVKQEMSLSKLFAEK